MSAEKKVRIHVEGFKDGVTRDAGTLYMPLSKALKAFESEGYSVRVEPLDTGNTYVFHVTDRGRKPKMRRNPGGATAAQVAAAKKALSVQGIKLTYNRDVEEWSVLPKWRPQAEYFTDDFNDAIGTANAMIEKRVGKRNPGGSATNKIAIQNEARLRGIEYPQLTVDSAGRQVLVDTVTGAVYYPRVGRGGKVILSRSAAKGGGKRNPGPMGRGRGLCNPQVGDYELEFIPYRLHLTFSWRKLTGSGGMNGRFNMEKGTLSTVSVTGSKIPAAVLTAAMRIVKGQV
jgi:hypothetical protein